MSIRTKAILIILASIVIAGILTAGILTIVNFLFELLGIGTKELAAILLAGRIISIAVMIVVLYKQVLIFLRKPDPALALGRIVLVSFAYIVLVSNFVPVVVDWGVIFADLVRAQPTSTTVSYALSSCTAAVFSAISLLSLYIIAEKLLRDSEQ